MEKEAEARELLDQLYSKIDEGGLNNWEQAMFDVLSWWLDDSDKPELD
jgi:hypothetical protein